MVFLNLNGAIMIHYDSVDNGQTQARSSFFGGKMRQKKFIQVFRIDANAVISKLDNYHFSVFIQSSGDVDFTFLFDGIDGVFKQVDKCATNLFAIEIQFLNRRP